MSNYSADTQAELDSIVRHQRDHPDSVCFKRAEDFNFSLEQRLGELEVESLIGRVTDVVQQRRGLFTRAEAAAILPQVCDVKPIIQLRDERWKSIDAIQTVHVPEITAPAADVLQAEVDLAGEKRNTYPYALNMLQDFYRDRRDFVAHRRYMLLHRFSRLCNDSESIERTKPFLDSRLRESEAEYEDVISRLDRLQPQSSSQATLPSEVPIKPSDFQPLLRSMIFDVRATTKVQRFYKKLQWLTHTHRYEIYERSKELFKDVFLAQEGTSLAKLRKSVRPDAYDANLPSMLLSPDELDMRLQELKRAFDMTTDIDSDEGQEFFYFSSKKFSSVFGAQHQALQFLQYDLVNPSSSSNGGNNAYDALRVTGGAPSKQATAAAAQAGKLAAAAGNGALDIPVAVPTYLKISNWTAYQQQMAKISDAQEAQDARLRSIRQLDSQLRVEATFLDCTDQSYAAKRLKEQSDTHMARAQALSAIANRTSSLGRDSSGMTSPAYALDMSDDAGSISGSEADHPQFSPSMAPKFKVASLYYLRFVRTREFKRKLLGLLNYFRSVERRFVLDSWGFPHTNGSPSSGSSSSSSDPFASSASSAASYSDELHGSSAGSRPASAAAGAAGGDNMSEARYHSVAPDFARSNAATSTAEMMKATSIENRDDSYVLGPKNDLLVYDSNGVCIMYDAALKDMDDLQENVLRLGTLFISSRQGATKSGHTMSQREEDVVSATVDRCALLEDLLECEHFFAESKKQVLDGYLEAYEHCVDPQHRRRLAQCVLDIIALRPSLDLSAPYFVDSYASSVVCLELHQNLLRELSDVQIREEKSTLAAIHSQPRGDKNSSSHSLFGYPANHINDQRIVKSLFPGSALVPIVDFYSTLWSVSSLPSLLQSCVDEMTNRYQIRNLLARSCLQRAVLEQALVEWRLLVEEERMARQLQADAAPIPQISSAPNPLAPPQDEIILLESAEEMDALVREVATAVATAPKKDEGSLGSSSVGAGVNKQRPGASSSDKKDDLEYTEGQYPLCTAPGGPGLMPAIAHLLQTFSNATEAVSLRKNILDILYETEILYNIYRRQAHMMGRDVRRFQLDSLPFEKNSAHRENPDEIEQPTDAGEVLALKTEYLSNLAICEFEASMGSFDFHNTTTVKNLLDCTGLDELRRAFQVQVLQKNMLLIIVRHNQIPIDGYTLQYSGNFAEGAFLTAAAAPEASLGVGRMRPNRREILRRFSERIPSEEISKSEYRQRLTRLFVSLNDLKISQRSVVLNEYSQRSVAILKSKRPDVIRRRLRILKYELIGEYCSSLIRSVRKLALQTEVADVTEAIRNSLSDVPEKESDLLPFTPGSSHDEIEADGMERASQGIIRKHLPRAERIIGERPARSTCMMSRNGLLLDPFYLPHFAQIFSSDFRPSAREQAATALASSSSVSSPTPPSGDLDQDAADSLAAAYKLQNSALDLSPEAIQRQVASRREKLGISHPIVPLPPRFEVKMPSSEGYNFSDQCLTRMLYILSAQLDLVMYMRAANKSTVPGHMAALEGQGLASVPHEFNKLAAELEHVRDTRSADCVLQFLLAKRSLMAIKFNLVLRNLVEFFKVKENKAAQEAVQAELQKLVSISPASSVTTLLDPIYASANSSSHPLNVAPAAAYTVRFWPQGELFSRSSTERRRDWHQHVMHNLDQWQPIPGSWRPSRLSLALNTFLHRMPEPDRSYFNAECLAVDLLLDDLLSDEKVYSTNQSELATALQLEFLAESLSLSLLREKYVQHILLPYLPREADRNNYERVLEAYKARILPRSRKIITRIMAVSPPPSHHNSAIPQEGGSGDVVFKMTERLLRRGQILALRQELDKFFLQEYCQTLSAIHRTMMLQVERAAGSGGSLISASDARSISSFKGSRAQSNIGNSAAAGGAASGDHEVVSSLASVVGDPKQQIASDFVSQLNTRAINLRTENGDAILQIPEAHVQKTLDTLFQRLQRWRLDELSLRDTHHASTVAHLRQLIFRQQQRISFLEMSREFERKALALRVQCDVSDRSYATVFELEALKNRNSEILQEMRLLEVRVRSQVRTEFEDHIRDLTRQLLLQKEKFKEYKSQLYSDIQSNLQDVKKEAMLQMVESQNAPLELKRKALKIARTDDEVNKLKHENTELQSVISKMKLFHSLRVLQLRAKYETVIVNEQEAHKNAAREYWSSREATEEMESGLRQQLLGAQNQLSASEIELERLKKELSQQTKNKQALVHWKVKNAQSMTEIAEKVKKYERWSNYDVDKLLLEIQRKDEQLKQLSDVEVRLSKNTEKVHQQRDKEVQRLQKRLSQEQKLKLGAFSKLDEMRSALGAAIEASSSSSPLAANGDESLLWRARYFDSEAELQRKLSEVEVLKAQLSDHGLPLPPSLDGLADVSGADGSPIINSARSASGSMRPKTSANAGDEAPNSDRPGYQRPQNIPAQVRHNLDLKIPKIPAKNSPSSGAVSASRGLSPFRGGGSPSQLPSSISGQIPSARSSLGSGSRPGTSSSISGAGVGSVANRSSSVGRAGSRRL